VLEIGSGTGQHAVHFAAALPQLTWQTSDLESNLSGIRSRLEGSGLPNLPPPIALDVTGAWPDTWFDAAFTANTLHIMGWPEVQTLFAALPEILSADAMLAVYGPFNYNGRFTSPSNAAFDEWLKQHSPHSGIRDFALVDELARSSGFALVEDRPMPANNRTLVWRRAGVRRRKRHYVKKTLATLLVALTGTFCVSPTHASDLRRQVGAYRATHEKDIVTQLDALTRLPSVAAPGIRHRPCRGQCRAQREHHGTSAQHQGASAPAPSAPRRIMPFRRRQISRSTFASCRIRRRSTYARRSSAS
jgi:hypothetical protein